MNRFYTRHQKPVVGAKLNRKHPLAQGLVLYFPMNEVWMNSVQDVVNDLALPANTSSYTDRGWKGGWRGGTGYYALSASPAKGYYTAGTRFGNITGNAMTVAVGAEIWNSNYQTGIAFGKYFNSTSPAYIVNHGYQPNNDTAVFKVNGASEIRTEHTSGTNMMFGTLESIDGVLTTKTWLNGVQKNSTTIVSGWPPTYQSSQAPINVAQSPAGAYWWEKPIYVVAVWDRALTPAEMQAFNTDPFCVLES